MKRIITLISSVLLFAACNNHDDFDFTGTVIDYEECVGSSFGYAVSLTSPDTIGGDYHARDGENYQNVVVIYGADRLLQANSKISGRIYLAPYFSKTECNIHYTDNDVPEAVFTKLKVEK
ncbi:MAG: hypothetical protein J5882_06865 [Bacteroidales bacterium]|nr:hypothetical protein [Bacteroidales bacterium]